MIATQGVGRPPNEPARLLPSDDDKLDADAQDLMNNWFALGARARPTYPWYIAAHAGSATIRP
jgi:hypothetical protein